MKHGARKLSRVPMVQLWLWHKYGLWLPVLFIVSVLPSPVSAHASEQLIQRCAVGDRVGLGLLPAGVM